MKSLKERLAEKKKRQKKEDRKLSGKVRCFRVSIPYAGFPPYNTQGDKNYIKRKAFELVDKIYTAASEKFYNYVKEAIEMKENQLQHNIFGA